MNQPSDFSFLTRWLNQQNETRHLTAVGYRPSRGHWISPHTGELVSQESALETERTLCTTQTDQPT